MGTRSKPLKEGPKTLNKTLPITGRCYCGHSHVVARTEPQTVCYCHCSDCRRWTGAPVAAFAAFAASDVALDPEPTPRSHVDGVRRWVCPECGSPLLAAFDYLPEQVYLPLGLLDHPDHVAPLMHTHAESQIAWLHIDDDTPRISGSGREALR